MSTNPSPQASKRTICRHHHHHRSSNSTWYMVVAARMAVIISMIGGDGTVVLVPPTWSTGDESFISDDSSWMVQGFQFTVTTITTTSMTAKKSSHRLTDFSHSWIFPSNTGTTSTMSTMSTRTTTTIFGHDRSRPFASTKNTMRKMCPNEHKNDNSNGDQEENENGSTDCEIIESVPSITSSSTSSDTIPTIDHILSQLTLGFPLFVVWFAIMGLFRPSTLVWINHGPIVTILLALVMFGTGLTLQKQDFSNIWETKVNRYSVLLGVLCQFIIMPSTAYIVGQFFFLGNQFVPPAIAAAAAAASSSSSGSSSSPSEIASALFLGLCFVGCSPGGTASNVVTYIANANVALSVVLTSCSTFAAVLVTPLLIKLLLRNTIYGSATSSIGSSSTSIQISGWSLCTSTAKVVLLPIIMGMIFKTRLPRATKTLCRFTPFLSVLFVSMICGGVVAQTAAPLLSLSGIGSSVGLFPIILSSVLSLHIIGFLAGYIVPKIILPNDAKTKSSCRTNLELTARTISIEVGMQNSALAVVLARSIPNLHPVACLPGAISATVHSCLGSILAAIWRWQSSKDAEIE